MKMEKPKSVKSIQNFQPKKFYQYLSNSVMRKTIEHKNLKFLNLLKKKKNLSFPENLALEKQLHLNG